jgi:hypothetical protein
MSHWNFHLYPFIGMFISIFQPRLITRGYPTSISVWDWLGF